MKHKYSLYFYKTSSKREVIIDFIDELDEKTKARVRNALRLLERYGLELLPTPWVKKIYKKPSIFELRITGKKQLRLLFFQYDEKIFMIVNIFVKKRQKTPPKEIEKALQRTKEFV